MSHGSSGRIRIAFLSRYPPMHCGVGEYTRLLASALRSIAPWLDVVVLTSTRRGKKPWRDELLGIEVLPVFDEGDQGYEGMLDALAAMEGVDVLHVQHEYGIFGRSVRLVKAVEQARNEGLVRRAVITMHTVFHPSSGREESGFQELLNTFDAIIVHSILQEFELQWQGVEPSRIHRIPHGTLINPYLGFPRNVLASSLGIKPGLLRGLILVVPGFLRPDKGFDVLFEALSQLESLNTTVVVAGEPRDKSVMGVIEAARARQNIVLIDRYLSNDEILRVIGLADILVLPYKDKAGTYSVSGILHLSMGGLKPIVGSRTPRLVELYQYAPRLTVPPRDPVELAKKIRWVVNNYDYAVAYMATLYGYAARTQWPRMARRHLELYTKLLAGKPREPSLPDEESIASTD